MTEIKKPDAAPVIAPAAPADPATPPAVKPDEEKTAEELAAEAEAIEAEIKAGKKQTPDEIKANQLQRLKNAREKREAMTNGVQTDKSSEFAVEDLVTLEVKGIDKNSDEAKLLKRYVDAGIVKTFKEAYNHVGVKAELEALAASKNAATVIDENDTEAVLKTKKEAIAQARASGEVPEDPEMRKALVEDNISRMSQLN
jgi:hypothetical protein